MSAARGMGLLAVAAAVAAVALVWLGSGSGYTVVAQVDNAGQIVEGNEVKIGAAAVGTVNSIELTENGLAELELEIDEDDAPLRARTHVSIRANSLAGVANRYVELAPPAGEAEPLPSGARITPVDTSSPVEFDAFLNTLDADTRSGLRSLIAGEAAHYGRRTEQANLSLRLLAPALSSTGAVMEQLAADAPAFRRLIRDGSIAAGAVAERRTQLTDLISNAATTTGAFADEAGSVRQTLARLPGTMRQANTTFVNLRAALDDLDVLVASAKPATRDLPLLLRRLRPLLDRARTTVPDLSAVVDSGGPDDLTGLLGRLPAVEAIASSALPRAIRAMDESQDVLAMLRLYTPDLAAAFGNLGAVTSYYDASGHYARGIPVTSALGYDREADTLRAKPPQDRLDGFEVLQGGRCPGGAIQDPPDGSAPVDAEGCDPTTTPPGP